MDAEGVADVDGAVDAVERLARNTPRPPKASRWRNRNLSSRCKSQRKHKLAKSRRIRNRNMK